MHLRRFICALSAVLLVLVISVPAFASDGSGEEETVVESVPVLTDVVSYTHTVTADGSNTFQDVLLTFLGDYDAVVVEYQYSDSAGNVSYERVIQPDYVWLASCVLLVVFLFCLFRLGGAVLCRQ